MRVLFLLIVLIKIHFLSFSQKDSIYLRPKIEIINKDTLFCWNIEQSKVIAKYIVDLDYKDSLIKNYQKQIQLNKTILLKKDKIILLKNGIVKDKENEIILNDKINHNLIKKIRANNRKRTFGISLFCLFVGFIISK